MDPSKQSMTICKMNKKQFKQLFPIHLIAWIVVLGFTLRDTLAIEVASSTLPGDTTLQIDTGRVSYTVDVRGTSENIFTTYPYQVYVRGTDIYGNPIFISVAQGTVTVRGQIANPGGVPEAATTDRITGSWTVPNDGTLHNTTSGYRLIVEVYTNGTPFPTTRAALGTNTVFAPLSSGTLTIDVVPDIGIPAVRQIVKSQATAGIPVLVGGALANIPVATPGTGYDASSPPTVTVTPANGSTVRAVVNQTTGSISRFEIINAGAGFAAPPVITVAIPPTYMTQRMGGLLYDSGTYYGGDILRFQTTIQNLASGVGDRQGRPLRPSSADRHRIQTVLTTDPAYTASSGSDDFQVFFTDITGDMSGAALVNSPIQAIQVYGTPNGFMQAVPPVNPTGGVVPATYGLPTGGIQTAATAVLIGDRVGTINITPGGGNSYDDTFPPAVTIAGGGGSGATAQAVVTAGQVTAINIINAGAGYTTAPTVTIAPPLVGARYYQPLPDDGFLDLGERIELDYEVLMPKNYAGIYFAAARANTLGTVVESDTGNSEPSRNNTVVANSTLIRLLSGPQENTQLLSGIFSTNGSLQVLSNAPSEMTSIDGVGRYVVFQSSATNLTENSTTSNATSTVSYQQILRRQIGTSEALIASVSSRGAVGNGISQNPSINRSPQNLTIDGKFVAFESQANNLVDNDINLASDIFVRSYGSVLRTNLISVNQNGRQANSGSFNPSISGNGRFIAFESEATNLDLVNPLSTGRTATANVTVNSSGNITAAFLTNSGTGYDPYNPPSVTFVSPTGTGASATVSVAGNGTISSISITNSGSGYNQNGSSTSVFIDSPLPLRPTGLQVYVHDRDVSGSGAYDQEGNTRTYLVSVSNNGSTQATATASITSGQVSSISIINGGQNYVPQYPPAVVISAPPSGGQQATAQAYVASNGTITAIRITNPGSGYASAPIITVAPRARPAADHLNRPGFIAVNNQPRLSDDGSVVTWVSYSSNLQMTTNSTVMIGNNGWRGVVYRMKLQSGIPLTSTLEAVSVNGAGTNVTNDLANDLAYEPSINGDGSVIAFTTWADNLGNIPDTNGVADVFVRDYNLPLASNRTRRVSQSRDRLSTGSVTFPNSFPSTLNSDLGNNFDTITMNDGVNQLTFTFTPNAPIAVTDVQIGATMSITRDNLVRAINNAFRANLTTIVAGNLPTEVLGTVNKGNNETILTAAELFAFTEPGPNSPANANFFTSATALPGPALIPSILLVNTVPGVAGNQNIVSTNPNILLTGMQNGGRQADIDSGELLDGVLGGSDQPALDYSGYAVAYRSMMQTLDVFDRSLTGTNGLLPGQTIRMLQNASSNVFVADRNGDPVSPTFGDTETSTRASVSRFGYRTSRLLNTFSSADSHKPALSASGRFVTFSSDSENNGGLVFGPTNFDPLDTNGFRDVFLHDRLIDTELPPPVENNQPEVILTEPLWLSGTSVAVGSEVYLNAFASDLDDSLGLENVVFIVNGTPVPATERYGNYFSATYRVLEQSQSNNIFARVIDNSGADNNTAISPAITFQSGNALPRPISITLSEPDLQGRAPTVGQSITINAVVSMPYIAWGNASIGSDFGGIVNFYANGILVGQVDVNTGANNQNVSFNWIPQSAGNVTITALATNYSSGRSNWATLLSNSLPSISVVGLPDEAPEGSPQNIAQELFQIVMSRTPNAQELDFYSAQLTSGALTPATMVGALIALPEYNQFQNKLFDFHYRLGATPQNYNYLSNLSLMKSNNSLLPAAEYDALQTNPATPYGSTLGQALAAQSIIESPSFSQNAPGVASYTTRDFWNWLAERMKLYGGISTVYGNGSLIVSDVMNATPAAPQGSGVAFTIAYYAANNPSIYGISVNATGTNQTISQYQYQLKATALQWLFTGNWSAPTALTVTDEAQLNTLISALVGNFTGQTTWSWVLANGLTGANATQNASLTGGSDQQNLKKYAFNANATQSLGTLSANGTSGLPLGGAEVVNGISYLTLTYVKRKNSPTVTYIPEFAWEIDGEFVPATPSNSVSVTTSIDDTWERVTVRDTAPNNSSTPVLRRFGRIRLLCTYWTPANP
jgi:hypothetical protein